MPEQEIHARSHKSELGLGITRGEEEDREHTCQGGAAALLAGSSLQGASLTYEGVLAHASRHSWQGTWRRPARAQPKSNLRVACAAVGRPLLGAGGEPGPRGFVECINPGPEHLVEVGPATLAIPGQVCVAV